MILLLNGDNIFELNKALADLISEYKNKNYSIENIDGGTISTLGDAFGGVDAMSFFSESKIIVIKRIFSNRKTTLLNEAAEYIAEHKDSDIIFWEDKKADKRGKLYKTLSKIGVVREYTTKNLPSLKTWIHDELKKANVKISSSTLDELLFKVGSDQQILHNELIKLINLVEIENRDEIINKDLEIVPISKEASIWEFIDAIVDKKYAKSLTLLEEIIKDKTEYIKNMGMIVRQLRILAQADYHIKSGQPQKLYELGIPPFAIDKLKNQLKNFSSEKIQQLYSKLVNLDLSVKEGKIDEKLGLTLYILSF
jgi:DNA polymerase III subunit delta